MAFKNICSLVFWTKVASALEGLRMKSLTNDDEKHIIYFSHFSSMRCKNICTRCGKPAGALRGGNEEEAEKGSSLFPRGAPRLKNHSTASCASLKYSNRSLPSRFYHQSSQIIAVPSLS